MSSLRGVIVEKGNIGANVENLDGVSAIVTNAPSIDASANIVGVENGKVYLFMSLSEAEGYGITAEYDIVNDVRVHRHISEFFRMAGDGTKLYVYLTDVNTPMNQMLSDNGHQIIAESKGEIRYIALAYNPPVGYTPTYINGLETELNDTIPVAQELASWCFSSDKPINVFVEGRGISESSALTLQNLRDFQIDGTSIEYGNVSVCIGQDWNYADTLTGEAKNMADVGTMLGTKAKIPVNYNIGEVGEDGDVNNNNLSNVNKQVWLVAGLSNHKKNIEWEDSLQTLNDKGYIFGISYTGITGFRWNDDHVCAPVIIDADGNMNVHTIALGATQNKLARLIRKYLLPKVKKTVPLDIETGKLTPGMVKYFEGVANKAFSEMLSAGEISGGSTVVNPESDLATGLKELQISYSAVPTGIVGQIRNVINIKKSL